MSDPNNVVDLDKYRQERVKEGTWPPDPLTVREYWKSRRGIKPPPVYDRPKGGGAA